MLISGYGRASTTEVFPTKDSYVDSYEPMSNFGGQNKMESGYWGFISIYLMEAYLYFSLSQISEGWTKVELYLDFWLVSQTIEFDIIQISEGWSEYTINFVLSKSQYLS